MRGFSRIGALVLGVFAVSVSEGQITQKSHGGPATTAEAFESPEAAAAALIQAATRNDTQALAAIFGQNGIRVLSSGNPQRDEQERAQFAKLAQNKFRIETDPMNSGRKTLDVGTQDWPFPVPIVRKGEKWSFDSSAGASEMQVRRVGANELDAIEICAGYVEAQREYAWARHDHSNMHAYAQQIMSTPGKRDGLYGGASAETSKLVPKGFAEASVDARGAGTGNVKPYHGYLFRVLTAQGPNASGGAHNYLVKDVMIGGFGLVAWPAQYGTSGIHTFIINQDGAVFEKDLGRATATAGPSLKRFDPDRTWVRVQ